MCVSGDIRTELCGEFIVNRSVNLIRHRTTPPLYLVAFGPTVCLCVCVCVTRLYCDVTRSNTTQRDIILQHLGDSAHLTPQKCCPGLSCVVPTQRSDHDSCSSPQTDAGTVRSAHSTNSPDHDNIASCPKRYTTPGLTLSCWGPGNERLKNSVASFSRCVRSSVRPIHQC